MTLGTGATADRAALEAAVRVPWEGGDQAGAASAAIRGFGPELLEYLLAVHRDENEASEVFALVTEALWRSLPSFAWESSFRTWAYAVTRRTSLRYRRDERRRAARQRPLPEGAAELVAMVRTDTLTYLRTRTRSRIAELRRSLSPEDQQLLILRVDRGLEWIELARVFADDDASMDSMALARESARLRKRFQLVKARLRELAMKEGLIDVGDAGR